MVNLAVIDFCGTVANFQTLDPFLENILRNEKPVAYKVLSNIVVKRILDLANRILLHLGCHYFLRKRLMVLALQKVSERKLYEYGKEYYIKRVKPCLITETIKLIEQFKDDGYMTVIVSGGSKFYIQYFAQEYGIDGIISAEIEIKNGKCTGRLLRECIGDEKVEMLRKYICENGLTVLKKACVTDSKTDLPILNECERKIIISHGVHSKWVTQDMEEIIWE